LSSSSSKTAPEDGSMNYPAVGILGSTTGNWSLPRPPPPLKARSTSTSSTPPSPEPKQPWRKLSDNVAEDRFCTKSLNSLPNNDRGPIIVQRRTSVTEDVSIANTSSTTCQA
jgi:hypothetical protein